MGGAPTGTADAPSPTEPGPWQPANPTRPTARWVFLRFLRYGLLAWGGPVAQIALMHRELVQRDGWVTEERFRKLFGLYQALPGPEALELAVYFGLTQAGRRGGLMAGLGFGLPGVLLVTALAALWANGLLAGDAVEGALFGMRAAAVGLVAVAALRLGRATVRSWDLALLAAASFAASFFLGLNFLVVLGLAGLLSLGAALLRTRALLVVPPVLGAALALPGFWLPFAWLFLKAGLLTFGGAYTIVPILHEGAVAQQAWLAEEDLVTALALTGVVPTPFVAVGTFVGYQVAGPVGALVATPLVFGPAFAFTLGLHRWFERVLASERWHRALLGVAAAVLGLLAHAVVPLARAALVGPEAWGLAVAAGALLARMRGIPLVLLGAGAAGVALRFAGAA